MGELGRELKYTVRGLLKAPAFTVIAVMTLAVGIGGNTAIFSVVRSVLLSPLPYDDPDQLVVVGGQLPGLGTQELTASAPEYRDYVEQSSSLAELAATWTIDINITGVDQPIRARDAVVTWNFLSMLGAEPILGRGFTPEDAGGDIGHVAILSYATWQRLYGGDPDVIGTIMLIDDDPIEIIGVMPEGFVHPGEPAGSTVDSWAPVDISQDSRFGQGRAARRYTLIGRLESGVTATEAQSEFRVIAENLRREYPGAYPVESGWTASVVPLMDQVVGGVRTSLWVLLGSVGMVLLIACTNVANLLLARGGTRSREVAIRSAVGGGRAVIARQFLLESVVLGVVGGAVGLVLSSVGIGVIRESASAFLPRLEHASLDGGMLAFTAVIALGTSLLFGLIPAVRLSRTDLQDLLSEGSRGSSGGHRRVRDGLVVAQIAISLTLLVGSGLMLKSHARLMSVDLGFDPERVMTMRTFLPWTITPEDGRYFQQDVRIQFYDEGLRLLEELPGVERAGLVTRLSLRRLNGVTFTVEGGDALPGEMTLNAEFRQISPSYFETMGAAMIQGRSFTSADDVNTPRVVMVNQAWAERHSPDDSPVGKRVTLGSNPEAPLWEIVGVVGNIRQHGLDAGARETIYASHRQGIFIDATWVIKTTGDPEDITQAAIGAIRSLDPTLPIFAQTPMSAVVAATIAERRLVMNLLSLFALQAIVLAAIGIYGVISQAVTQRTREIGIRMAIGAERGSVLGLILKEGLWLGAWGVGVGALVSVLAAGLLESLLYTVESLDPLVFTAVAALALLVVSGATLLPAARATRVDPLVTMKAD
jgi:predicted permease